MKKCTYKIEFLSDWLCGSGLSSGNNADIIPILDSTTGLPFVPGKTLKGLIREQMDLLNALTNEEKFSTTGIEINGNAEIKEKISSELIPYLFRDLAGVQINKDGVAVNKSLRVKKVVIPVELHGELAYDETIFAEAEIRKILQMIKSLGEGRNKGLGRCRITLS